MSATTSLDNPENRPVRDGQTACQQSRGVVCYRLRDALCGFIGVHAPCRASRQDRYACLDAVLCEIKNGEISVNIGDGHRSGYIVERKPQF
jgi:hypothetical protein